MKYVHYLTLVSMLIIPASLLACPDMQGSYKTEGGGTQIYLKKDNASTYQVVINILSYPLTIKTAAFVSDKDRKAQAYQILPECTLSIAGFGSLLPHKKGSAFYLHFDSQDYEKVFNTEYILKLNDTPAGYLGMIKTMSALPDKAITELNKH